MKSLSIITLTRNRAPLLRKCLKSIVGQLGKSDELVIIDNNSTDETHDVIKSYQSQLPIRYHKTPITGYPRLYNLAIQKSTKDILVFLDDDCIASKNYIAATRRAHHKYKNAVIQGLTYSLPRGNIYAEIMGDHYQNWLRVNTLTGNQMRTFDNKNASVARAVLGVRGGFSDDLTHGSEDIDLGIRLRKKGIKIFLEPSIIAYHHERSTFRGFWSQHLRIAKSEGILDQRLSNKDKIRMLHGRKTLLNATSAVRREINYLRAGRIKDFFLLPPLYLTLLFTRIWGYIKAK